VLGLILLVSLVRRYRRDPASLRLWEQPAVAGGPPPVEAQQPQTRSNKRRKRR